MRITEIRAAGLRHGTPEGGWANEIRPDDCVHTLVAVFTDEGITGWGSAFTNDELVRGRALHLLEPLYLRRESAGTRARQRETARAHFLDGPRRIGHARHQRHRYRDVGHPRQGHRSARRAAAGRPISRARAALCLAADVRAARAGRNTLLLFGRRDSARSRSAGDRSAGSGPGMDEAIVRAAREAVCAGLAADGGCRGQRRLLAAGLQMGRADSPDAGRLRRVLVRGAAPAGQPARLRHCCEVTRQCRSPAGKCSRAGSRSRPGSRGGRSTSCSPTSPRSAASAKSGASPGWPEENGVRFIPHGWNTALGLAADLQLASAIRNTDLVEYLTGSPFIDELVESPMEAGRGRNAGHSARHPASASRSIWTRWRSTRASASPE